MCKVYVSERRVPGTPEQTTARGLQKSSAIMITEYVIVAIQAILIHRWLFAPVLVSMADSDESRQRVKIAQ